MSLIVKNDDLNESINGKTSALMMTMLQDCVQKLKSLYPYNIWHAMSSDGSTIAIRALDISDKLGYVLHATTVQSDPDLKCVMRAGGEILERARQTTERIGKMSDPDSKILMDTTNAANTLDSKYHNNQNLLVGV